MYIRLWAPSIDFLIPLSLFSFPSNYVLSVYTLTVFLHYTPHRSCTLFSSHFKICTPLFFLLFSNGELGSKEEEVGGGGGINVATLNQSINKI